MLGKLQTPTANLVISYQKQFEQGEYAIIDKAISKLFQTFPRNDRFEEVLLKVTALNGLYYTNILATYEVAKRICELKIDSQLEQESPELVDIIAPLSIRGKTRRNYSFASKYCSWHVPDAYPIYDSFVERLIWAYYRQDSFARFKRSDLQSYPRYKEVVEAFRNHYRLTRFNFKELDKFLWLYGKKVFASRS